MTTLRRVVPESVMCPYCWMADQFEHPVNIYTLMPPVRLESGHYAWKVGFCGRYNNFVTLTCLGWFMEVGAGFTAMPAKKIPNLKYSPKECQLSEYWDPKGKK